ncbi:YceH family protein [Serratia grimesii]|uniref:YceH family protein n=1 Tax=Serratia grimesii TaxID=82995 RepID=UPI00383B665A
MKYELSAKEARVIGCLLEKQVTTPDQYPLSLNGITLACNQKTNREPVMDLAESEVQQHLDLLLKKHFLRTLSGFGNRVVKYEHRFCNSEFGQLKLSAAELAVIATLLLRGAQTPGELRTRTNRMHEFNDVTEVEQVLANLSAREDGPFVVRLAREPGKRESRFMHLFCGQIDEAPAEALPSDETALHGRVTALENVVAQLKQQLQALLARGADE